MWKAGSLTPLIVVLGTGPLPAADLLPGTPDVHAASPDEVREVLAGAAGDVLLVDPMMGCSAHYPVDDVCQPGRTSVLVGEGGSAPLRVHDGAVASAGTSAAPLHDANSSATGCLQIAEGDLPALADALDRLPRGPRGRLWEQILAILVMSGLTVRAVDATPFRLSDDREPPERARHLQALRCARSGDGWLSERTVRRLSPLITPWAVRWGVSPNTVTAASLLAGAAAVAAAATGTRAGYVATAVLMLVSLVLDCVDGEVARWTHRYSRAGGWLDAVGDRVKEYAVWFAVGVAVAQDGFWQLVLACLVLFTAKHFLDYGWSLRHPAWRLHPVAVTGDPDPWYTGGQVPPRVWPPSWRRVLGMPIAERWLLLIVLLPTAGPWAAFAALAAAGAASLLYTVATRIRWSSTPVSPATRAEMEAITDPGPLLLLLRPGVQWAPAVLPAMLALPVAAAVGGGVALAVGFGAAVALFALGYGRGPRGRLGWFAPAVARTAEMTGLLAVAAAAGVPHHWPAVFAVLAASAWRYYDVIYRIRHQGALPGRAARWLLLGSDGRVGLGLAVALLAGVQGWWWIALYVAVVAVADSLHSWFGRG